MFNFHRLGVYRCAISFLSFAAPLADRAPRGFSSLSDQLRRASLSIPLNIAEGSGKYERDERRYFNLARGSALECAAIPPSWMSLKPSLQRPRPNSLHLENYWSE